MNRNIESRMQRLERHAPQRRTVPLILAGIDKLDCERQLSEITGAGTIANYAPWIFVTGRPQRLGAIA